MSELWNLVFSYTIRGVRTNATWIIKFLLRLIHHC